MSSIFPNIPNLVPQFNQGLGSSFNSANPQTSTATVQEFMSYFSKGIGRPNRFRVELSLPAGVNTMLSGTPWGVSDFVNTAVQSGNITATQAKYNSGRGAINIMCNQATFPQRTLLTWDTNQNSASFRIPYSFEYDPVTFTFYADSTMNTRRYFEIWQSAVGNIQNNTMNYMSEFVAPVSIYQLDTSGKDTYNVQLIDAWPITLGSTDLSMNSMDAVHEITVTLAYRSYTSDSDDDYASSSTDQATATVAPSQMPNG